MSPLSPAAYAAAHAFPDGPCTPPLLDWQRQALVELAGLQPGGGPAGPAALSDQALVRAAGFRPRVATPPGPPTPENEHEPAASPGNRLA